MTGINSGVSLAISVPGMKRVNSTVVAGAAYGEELQQDETRMVSRSYEITAHNNPDSIIARADLELLLHLFCRESSMPSTGGVIQAIDAQRRALAQVTDPFAGPAAVRTAIDTCSCRAPTPVCGDAATSGC
jgi:hypothetical protein